MICRKNPLPLIVLIFSFQAIGNEPSHRVTPDLLEESFRLGRTFLLNQQTPEGRFNYEIDLLNGEISEGDSQVRQAGALWAISLIHQSDPTTETRDALLRGFRFFGNQTRKTETGDLYIVYPGERTGRTGTVALVSLALIDYLRSEPKGEGTEEFESLLKGYLSFLETLRTPTGQFAGYYKIADGTPSGIPSPYFDGETLLALTKAWKYLGRSDLEARIWKSAEKMHDIHVMEALSKDPDSTTTKGFYLWACLSYRELFFTDAERSKAFGERTLDLAHWMIDVHKTLERTKNTAYAQEGILAALDVAQALGEKSAVAKFERVAHQGLWKLTGWQVGVSTQNEYLQNVEWNSIALGGVMNRKDDPILRVDVTQHQMHAVILAKEILFEGKGAE